jgi:poly-gamma-glutamate synthesis protein (capsule biosynthesis protein)
MIDNGASIIHGHSAHIFQAVEVYRRGIILYDTGDFVDDYAVDPVLRNDRSFYFKAVLGRDGIRALKLIPVLIDHYQVNLAHGEHFRWAIERMRQLSVKFGTEIDDDGVVQLSIQAKNILK